MRTPFVVLGLIVAATLVDGVGLAQEPAAGPTFDVVSIKPSAPEAGPNFTANAVTWRPDGGLTTTRTPVSSLIARAYPGASVAEMIGLPPWALRAFYDISATSPLAAATAGQRTAMLRAMLAERFRLLAHTERRELPSYDLVLDRKDGRLGPGLVRSGLDCETLTAARRAAAEAGSPRPEVDPNKPPPCVIVGSLNAIKGEVAISVLTQILRGPTGRHVVDKTGLRGTYRVDLTFDLANVALGAVAPPENSLSVFTAVREQLGLRLDSSRTEHEVLVIDRLEPPTEN
jgi:uncharacterized protein (TIGR03435 family)